MTRFLIPTTPTALFGTNRRPMKLTLPVDTPSYSNYRQASTNVRSPSSRNETATEDSSTAESVGEDDEVPQPSLSARRGRRRRVRAPGILFF
jgi:hypothetical protein